MQMILPIVAGVLILAGLVALFLSRDTWRVYHIIIGFFLLVANVAFFYLAARTLESGMHAGLTSPARPWMKLETPDPSLNRRPSVKAWLREVEDRMYRVFKLSNFYTELPSVYGDMGLFGTAAVGMFEDAHDVLRCKVFPVGSYGIMVDGRLTIEETPDGLCRLTGKDNIEDAFIAAVGGEEVENASWYATS